jgi:hypothetical protein
LSLYPSKFSLFVSLSLQILSICLFIPPNSLYLSLYPSKFSLFVSLSLQIHSICLFIPPKSSFAQSVTNRTLWRKPDFIAYLCRQLTTCFVCQLMISRYSFHFQRAVDYCCKYMKVAKPCYFGYPLGKSRVCSKYFGSY